MSISTNIIVSPDAYSMVNNEMWYQITTSTSSTPYENFKYIIDLNSNDEATGATTSLGRYVLPPRPYGGDCLFSPAKMLRTQVTQDLKTFTGTFSECPHSIVPYHLNVGMSYNTNVGIWGFEPSPITPTGYFTYATYSNYVTLVIATASVLYNIGDQLTIEKINNTINPLMNGTFTVLNSMVANSYYWVLLDYLYPSLITETPFGPIFALNPVAYVT